MFGGFSALALSPGTPSGLLSPDRRDCGGILRAVPREPSFWNVVLRSSFRLSIVRPAKKECCP